MGIAPTDVFALIGGSGADILLQQHRHDVKRLGPVPTPFGLSAALYRVRTGDARFLFLPRHGEMGDEIAAPWVNYRANIYALKEYGISRILAWSGPGGMAPQVRVWHFTYTTNHPNGAQAWLDRIELVSEKGKPVPVIIAMTGSLAN